jgi:hypothetical protein
VYIKVVKPMKHTPRISNEKMRLSRSCKYKVRSDAHSTHTQREGEIDPKLKEGGEESDGRASKRLVGGGVGSAGYSGRG